MNLSLNRVFKHPKAIKVFAAIGFCLLGDAMLYAVLPTRVDVLAFSGTQLGIILAANRVIRLGSNFWAAFFYEKFGRYFPFVLAVLLGVVVTFGYGFFQLFWQLLVLRLLWGFSYSLLRLKALLIIFDSGKPENIRGRLSGMYRSLSRSGYMAGMVLGGYLADLYGISKTAIILGLISSISLFLIFDREENEKSTTKTDEALASPSGLNIKNLFTDSRLLILMLMGFALHFTGMGLINSSYGLYLTDIFGQKAVILGYVLGVATLNGILLSSRSVLELILSPFFGNIMDRHNIKGMLIILFLLQGFLMMILAAFPIGIIAVVTPVLFFVNTTFLVILLYLRVGEQKEAEVSHRMAGFTTAGDLGAALGPLSLTLLDLGLRLTSLYYFSAVLLVAAALLYYFCNLEIS